MRNVPPPITRSLQTSGHVNGAMRALACPSAYALSLTFVCDFSTNRDHRVLFDQRRILLPHSGNSFENFRGCLRGKPSEANISWRRIKIINLLMWMTHLNNSVQAVISEACVLMEFGKVLTIFMRDNATLEAWSATCRDNSLLPPQTYRSSDRIHCLIDDRIWCIIGITDNNGFLCCHCRHCNSQQTKQR
jgi:hypothetical protein